MPDVYTVASENEYVRIVHVALTDGQRAPTYTPASAGVVRIDLASGNVRYCDSPPPDNQRPDLRALNEIRVELKSAPSTEPSALDAVRIDPARYRVVLENDRVRVVRLGFGPREKGLMVYHPPRVLATLTDVAVKLLFSDGRTDERGAPAGVAAWLDAETLQTENASDRALTVVLVEPKSTRGF